MLLSQSPAFKQYSLITGNYWAFTLTDGALRMLVVLHFFQLGYTPLAIAMLFLFYEIFGVITNLVGGWLGARLGLNRTMNIGLALQIVALTMLTVPEDWLSVAYVMAAQALSGIAKDLNKMSAKSSIKMLIPNKILVPDKSDGRLNRLQQEPNSQEDKLYRWVALLTGSKNALKGVGFFLGGILLNTLGFQGGLLLMAGILSLVWIVSLFALEKDLGKAKYKPKFSAIFSKSRSINILSAARLFLFGSRDVWFVVALPVYLSQVFDWDHWQVGSFMAIWVIGYGIVQSFAPYFTGKKSGRTPTGRSAFWWASYLSVIPLSIATALYFDLYREIILVVGLLIFGAIFAVNSSLHSYLIVSLASDDSVSLDVGFYYMANAVGRLLGTLLSGWVFQAYGLEACLVLSTLMIAITVVISTQLQTN